MSELEQLRAELAEARTRIDELVHHMAFHRSSETENLAADLAIARAEISDLKKAVVTMCDVYSANRSEKLRVKAFRRHAADGRPFSLDEVAATFAKLEASDRG